MSFAEQRLKDIQRGKLRFSVSEYANWKEEVVDALAQLIVDGYISNVQPIHVNKRGEQRLIGLDVTTVSQRVATS